MPQDLWGGAGAAGQGGESSERARAAAAGGDASPGCWPGLARPAILLLAGWLAENHRRFLRLLAGGQPCIYVGDLWEALARMV